MSFHTSEKQVSISLSERRKSCPSAKPGVLACPERKVLGMRVGTRLTNNSAIIIPSLQLRRGLPPTSITTPHQFSWLSPTQHTDYTSYVHVYSFLKVPSTFVNTHMYLFSDYPQILDICRHSVRIKKIPGISSKWKGDKCNSILKK